MENRARVGEVPGTLPLASVGLRSVTRQRPVSLKPPGFPARGVWFERHGPTRSGAFIIHRGCFEAGVRGGWGA